MRNGRGPNDSEANKQIYQLHILSLYREPTKNELALLSPDSRDLARYRDFLNSPDTGITKLIQDRNCAANTAVISATEDCLKYTMPGGGSSFSFRKEMYRIPRVADIMLADNKFYTPGLLQHSILANIGDVPIENITLALPELNYLLKFKPAKTVREAARIDDELVVGMSENGIRYGRSSAAVMNSTYLLRVVAYRGRILRAVQNVVYDEMTLDKRRDLIVAFRVIRQDGDGSLTLIWREIESKSSPRIK
jgi:hypothetical protein